MNVVDGRFLLHKVVWHRNNFTGLFCEKAEGDAVVSIADTWVSLCSTFNIYCFHRWRIHCHTSSTEGISTTPKQGVGTFAKLEEVKVLKHYIPRVVLDMRRQLRRQNTFFAPTNGTTL